MSEITQARKVFNKLGITNDKVQHAIVGAGVFAIGSTLGVVTAYSACIGAGVGKEVWDYFDKNETADIWDAIATIGGGVAMHVLLFLITKI